MRIRTVSKALLHAAAVLLLQPPAHAEGTSCTAPTAVVPDGRVVESSFGLGANYWLSIFTAPSRSYSLEVRSTTDPGFPSATPTLYALSDLDLGTCTGASSVVVRGTTGIPPALFNGGVRLSFTSNANGGFYYVRLLSGAGVAYSFSASETTLYSAAWSTLGTYNTYYSFFNTTNAPVSGVLTLTGTDGSLAGTTTVTIPTGRTASTNTVALGTPRGTAGTATFSHDGPPGAVLVEADIANFTLTPPYIQPVQFRTVRETR